VIALVDKFKHIVLSVSLVLVVTGCLGNDSSKKSSNKNSNSNASAMSGDSLLSECTLDALTSGACKITSSGVAVSSTIGSNVTSWSNGSSSTTVSATIPDGVYLSRSANFTDADLVASKIKDGVSIFGVTGTATLAYSACTNNALNASECTTVANRYVTATASSNATGADSSLSVSIPDGYSSARTVSVTDVDLVASKIKAGVELFGVVGSYVGAVPTNTASTAHRDPGTANGYITSQTTSLQLTVNEEKANYVGADLPTSGGYSYRDIPDRNIDTDNSFGTNCRHALRPTVDCGTTQTTIAARIADCAADNPTRNTWDGAANCSGGEGTWKLVVRDTANKEVWQDQRTGLLWSSRVSTATNWCRAAGNTSEASIAFSQAYNTVQTTAMVGNGTIGSISGGSSMINQNLNLVTFSNATTFAVTGTNCAGGSITAGGLTTAAGSTVTYSRPGFCTFTITQGAINFAANDVFVIDSDQSSTNSCVVDAPAGFQTTNAVSYCAEAAGLTGPAGDTWGTGIYQPAKGRLGKNSTPSVMWRLPSIYDFNQADVNGIRFVMPDLGIAGSSRSVPDASPGSTSPGQEWVATFTYMFARSPIFISTSSWNTALMSNLYAVRCVGR
jgi:hypothetical protein